MKESTIKLESVQLYLAEKLSNPKDNKEKWILKDREKQLLWREAIEKPSVATSFSLES